MLLNQLKYGSSRLYKTAQTESESPVNLGELRKGCLVPPHSPEHWKHLAQQASQEMNSDKLIELVNELNRVLGEHEEAFHARPNQGSQAD